MAGVRSFLMYHMQVRNSQKIKRKYLTFTKHTFYLF